MVNRSSVPNKPSSIADEAMSSPFSHASGGPHHRFGTFTRTVFDCKVVPQNHDVVCGRDSLSQRHKGNTHFRTIIALNRQRYQHASSRDIKTKITHEIVELVRSSQPVAGRFLKFDPKTYLWEDVGDEYAREKVSHALRSCKDPNRKKETRKRKASNSKPKIDYENPVFASLLDAQQKIFRQLLIDEGHDVDHVPTLDMMTPMSVDHDETESSIVSV